MELSGAWLPVCRSDELPARSDTAALVQGRDIVVSRDDDGEVYALDGSRGAPLGAVPVRVVDGYVEVALRSSPG